ncbi:MAG: hypothetical protein LBF22_14220 [Deltaproteobacteria bacterium]|jgi:hypothetical protein|nr:hypothetical protein [Deltaproteobacteria bacterium]
MYLKKFYSIMVPSMVICLAFFLSGCGDQKNPLLGSWHLDTSKESVYIKLGVSLITSGQNVSVLFGAEEMKISYGRGTETFKVTYTKNSETNVWSFCLNDGNNCFAAVFKDDKRNYVTFPLYGVNMDFIRQATD